MKRWLSIGLLLCLLFSLPAAQAYDFPDGKSIRDFVNDTLQELQDAHDKEYSEINKFYAALEVSVDDYTTAFGALTGKLIMASLIGENLTDEDISTIKRFGEDMHYHLVVGIENSTAASIAYAELLFGGAGKAEYDPDYQQIIGVKGFAFDELIQSVATLARELGELMDSVLKDKLVTGDECSTIAKILDSMNEMMALQVNKGTDTE